MRYQLTAGSAAIMALFSIPALAQEALPAGQQPAASDSNTPGSKGIAEVVVTAQRRAESLQSAGLPVDVVTGDAVVSKGLSTVADIGKIMPALNVQSGGGANSVFFLRGVGNFTVNGYSDPAIAFNYDGVYLGRPTSTSGMFYDLVRLEALKGPQGTLYGRNATAGAINVVPVRPKPGQNSGYVTASYGNFNAKNLQGAANISLGENAALRISGNIVDRDGYLSDGTSDEDGKALRAQLLVEVTPDLTARFSADYSHAGGKGGGSVYNSRYAYNPTTQRYDIFNAGFSPDTGLFDPAAQAYRQTLFLGAVGRNAVPLDNDVYLDNRFVGSHAEIEWSLPGGTLTVIPAWRDSKLNNKFGVPAFIGYIQEQDKQTSLEARFSGKRVGMFDYIVGAFHYDETVDGNYTFAQQALNAYQTFVSKTRSNAVFGRVTANLSDRFRLIGGLRETSDKKSFDGQADVLIERCTVVVGGRPSCPTTPLLPVTDSYTDLTAPFVVPALGGTPRPIGSTGAILIRATTPVLSSQKYNKMTYRIGAEYDLEPRSLLYASYETGFRAGGFSMSAGHETFAPEYIDAYTLGMKNRLLGNKLQVNLEAYYWKYRDQQVNHTGIDANGNQGQFTENIGNSVNRGVEADIQYLVVPSTLLAMSAQYLDATYRQFKYFEPAGATPPLTGCPYRLVGAQYEINCAGKPGYQAPRWTINLGVEHTIPLGANKLVASVDTQYKSSRYVGFQFLPNQLVNANWTSNARLSYGSENNSWSASVYVRNIGNDQSNTASQVFNAASVSTYIPAAPRTVGVQMTSKF